MEKNLEKELEKIIQEEKKENADISKVDFFYRSGFLGDVYAAIMVKREEGGKDNFWDFIIIRRNKGNVEIFRKGWEKVDYKKGSVPYKILNIFNVGEKKLKATLISGGKEIVYSINLLEKRIVVEGTYEKYRLRQKTF